MGELDRLRSPPYAHRPPPRSAGVRPESQGYNRQEEALSGSCIHLLHRRDHSQAFRDQGITIPPPTSASERRNKLSLLMMFRVFVHVTEGKRSFSQGDHTCDDVFLELGGTY